MNKNYRQVARGGFTFLEMIAAVTAAGLLVVGMTSTMFIALKAADVSTSPASFTLGGLSALTEIATDLQYAQAVTEQTATAVTVTVPDRNDAGTAPESIRYAWSGVAGDPLTRQLNSGTVANVVEDVNAFQILYYQPNTAVEYVTVHIQVSADTRTAVETSIPLLNRP